MTKKPGVFIGLIVLVLAFAGFFLATRAGWFLLGPKESSGPATPESVPETTHRCTLYTNEEYGFSLCYPVDWDLPQEEKITPSQQHLYQITLNPTGMSYMVNIYDQPSPVSLGSFVRTFFKDIEDGVSWSNEVFINEQEVLQFVIPKSDTALTGIGAIAFRKGNYVLTLSTPAKKAPEGDYKQLVNDETLTELAESFQWVE